jgi:hypothetical protein
LLRRGWVATREWKYTFRRRFPGGIVAELASSGEEISDGPAERSEFAAVGELIVRPPDTLAGGSGALDPLAWSEALRDVDLATMAAIADPATFVPSPAVVAMRASLVRAFLPEAIVDNTSARLPGGILSLANGAVQAPDGSPLPLPEMPKPAYFPYPNPDAGTVQVVARALHLATRAKSG